MDDPKQKSTNTKYYVSTGAFVIGLIVLLGLAYSPLSPVYQWWEKDVEVAPTPILFSTFIFRSAQDDEVVSSFVEGDIWEPKSGADFSDGYDDITDLLTNFERVVTGKDADDISIDLRDKPYYWLEITGNSVFSNTFHLLFGGANYVRTIYVHQPTSDINFAILNSTMASITIPGQATNDNYTAILKAPGHTIPGSHYGDNWAMSTADFAELSAREQKNYWKEALWRDQYPTYDPTLDTSNQYDRSWERLTNTFALKFTFGDPINTTDGAATQVNCTIGKGYPIETLISGANLYMVWDDGISFDPDYTFTFEMSFGANINLTTVISGRANVYRDLSSLTWSETYSTIGL